MTAPLRVFCRANASVADAFNFLSGWVQRLALLISACSEATRGVRSPCLCVE